MTSSYHLILPMPAGRTGPTTGVMSVMLVPRLQAVGKLADWTRDWSNWPRVINGNAPGPGGPAPSAPALAFSVRIDTGSGFVLNPANNALDRTSPNWLTSDPSQQAWAAVFGVGANSVPVERFRPQLRNGGGRLAPMFDAGRVASQLREMYRSLATLHTSGPPSLADLVTTPGYATLSTSDDLADYDAFMAPLGDGDVTDAETPEDADFHESIALLAAHPELLRLLGIIVDLQVTIPPEAAGSFQLVVTSNFETSYPLGKTVPVVVDVESDFWPSATSGEGPGRWATIGDASHSVESIDIDAGIAGLAGIADSADDASGTSPAPLRTAGLYVTRTPDDLVEELEGRWAAQEEFEDVVSDHLRLGAPIAVPADGEILVAGRRYDVYDETVGQWFSLWDREVPGGYSFPRNPSLGATPDSDEGWMTYTAFTEMKRVLVDPIGVPLDPPPNPNPNPDGPIGTPAKITPAPPKLDNTVLRVSPMLFSWRGWSSAANPPGRGFSGVVGPVDVAKNEPTTDMPVKVTIGYEVPDGVLPRLRYNRRYRFRARVVDVAGNSRTVDEPHPGGATETPLIRFGRTSPLGPPVPVRRVARPIPGWGDTTTTMVIKSELFQPDSTVTPTSRLLFPPQTDQYQCELHGYPLPDDALFRDQATFDTFVARTASSIDAHVVPDAVTEELVSDTPSDWRPDVDYLVEPGASGYSFAGLPGASLPVVSTLATSWPNAHAVGFEIRAGDRAPLVVAPTSTQASVTAYVPKGVTRTIETSVAGRSDLAPHWAALQDRAPGVFNALRALFVAGRHWMLSIAQPLTLVHAVRRPLAIPTTTSPPTPTRDLGSTQCSFAGTFFIDVKSTARIDVVGTWTDPVDIDGRSPTPTTKLLFTQQFDYAETSSAPIDQAPFEIGDTKRHDAELSFEAFSRYARYFTERATVQFTAPNQTVALPSPPAGLDSAIAEFNVSVTSGPINAVAGSDFTVDASAGTITHRSAGALPVNTDVDVDFIRLPISRRSSENGAIPVAVTIPNSAVPDVPLVAEVLPAFDRMRYNEGDTFGVSHQGQTIRVWVRRPWFTTGNGELLGVLVGDSATGPLNEVARDAMSRIGPRQTITVDDFPNAIEVLRDVTGTGGTNQVDVAGHEVFFDAATDRWFADISISADLGYRPFVKLALVRFQPASVQGAHVSEPVITEPVRLGATRRAEITRNGADTDVFVIGYELGNVMTAQFQYADTDIADADLRWRDIAPAVELTAAPSGFSDETQWTATLPTPIESRPVRVLIEDSEQLSRPSGEVDSVAYVETIEIPAGWTAPPPVVPGAPNDVSAAPQNSAVGVAWVAPADGGSPITQYTVEHRVGSGPWGTPVLVTAPNTTVVVAGLTNGVQYGFRVRARNIVGEGPFSDEVTATPATVPPAPVTTLQAFGGHRSVLLAWEVPADNGSAITGYRVERREGTGAWGSGVDLSPTRTRHIVRGLTNGVSYEFRVRAINAFGDGAWSAPAVAIPDVMTPGRVRRVSASTGGGLVLITWRPAAERGSPVTGYRIERRLRSADTWGTPVLVGANTLQRTIVGLLPGSEWEFRVRAQSAVGAGAWSSPVVLVVDGSGSIPAQVLGVAVEPGNGALTVTWLAANDGGSAVIRYTVQRRVSGDPSWSASVDVPGDQLVHRFTGLVNATTYEVRVRASNIIGSGDWSEVVAGSPAP